MAGFMLKATTLLAITHWGAAASSEEHGENVAIGAGAMMRRESPVRMHFSHDGKMKEFVHIKGKGKSKSKGADLCNDNYIQGDKNSSACPDGLLKIEEPTMCEEAALEACPDNSCLGDPFTIGDAYFNHYPSRCFITEDGKWHFNPTGYEPTWLMGKNAEASFPVCVEPEYHNGTAKADGSGECPDGYAVITHEDTCRTASTCLGKCPEVIFKVLNHTNNQGNGKKAPLGCHIAEDGCVRFNTIASDDVDTSATVICNLTVARGSEGASKKGGGGGGAGAAAGGDGDGAGDGAGGDGDGGAAAGGDGDADGDSF